MFSCICSNFNVNYTDKWLCSLLFFWAACCVPATAICVLQMPVHRKLFRFSKTLRVVCRRFCIIAHRAVKVNCKKHVPLLSLRAAVVGIFKRSKGGFLRNFVFLTVNGPEKSFMLDSIFAFMRWTELKQRYIKTVLHLQFLSETMLHFSHKSVLLDFWKNLIVLRLKVQCCCRIH